jgi:hypothetical protein
VSGWWRGGQGELRGVVPGELGLRWGTGGGKRCGLGGEAEAGEQAAGEVGIGDKGHDGAATAAGAQENVLGEGVSFTLHLVRGICPLRSCVGWPGWPSLVGDCAIG